MQQEQLNYKGCASNILTNTYTGWGPKMHALICTSDVKSMHQLNCE